MTDRPIRVQLSRRKGWKMPPNTVKVDRTTKWGNPYRTSLHCDQQHAVDCFRHLVVVGREARSAPDAETPLAALCVIQRDVHELRGKHLACWCRLDQPCHADVLLEIANG